MELMLVAGPAVEPLTIAEAKDHLRVEGTDEDALIDALVAAARQQAEAFTRRALITQTWRMTLDAFPQGDIIELPFPPLQSVTSITYVDVDGNSQTWDAANYDVDAPAGPYAGPGRIIKGYAKTYPATRSHYNAVTIEFVAGYGNAGSDVPEAIRTAVRQIVGTMYAHRETVQIGANVWEVPQTAQWLLWPFRALRF